MLIRLRAAKPLSSSDFIQPCGILGADRIIKKGVLGLLFLMLSAFSLGLAVGSYGFDGKKPRSNAKKRVLVVLTQKNEF